MPINNSADADKQFRALVADADKVEFTNLELLAPGGDTISYSRDLNVAQTRELVEKIRFLPLATASNLSTRTAYVLAFYRQNRDLARFDIGQTPPKLAPPSTIFAREGQIRYILNPRFEKQLQLYLRKLEKLPISVISS